MDSVVESVIVADSPDSGEFHDITEHRDKRLVVVDAANLHVWHDGTYYVGRGTADKVALSDVFYFPRGLSGDGSPLVKSVTRLETGDDGYEMVVFGPDVTISKASVLGDPIQIAQLEPPTRLEKQHTF